MRYVKFAIAAIITVAVGNFLLSKTPIAGYVGLGRTGGI